MGFVLDSSVLISAERKGRNARQALMAIALHLPGEDIALFVVTVLELMHGTVRADSPQRRATPRQFLQELLTAVPVHSVTVPVALRAGQLDGENASRGDRLALADLLIRVTALELGDGVLTGKVRHFERVPGLQVVRL